MLSTTTNGDDIASQRPRNRRSAVSAEAVSEARLKTWKRPIYSKTDEEKERLSLLLDKCTKAEILFGHLSVESMDEVIDAFQLVKFNIGDLIIKQGDPVGDNFYVIDNGEVEIFVNRDTRNKYQLGDSVGVFSAGDSFGELALLYNTPRAASVKVKSEECSCWALEREAFQMMLVTTENTRRKEYEGFLNNVELFKLLTKYEISTLSDLLECEVFDPNEIIIKQGDINCDKFYILEEGTAEAVLEGDEGEVVCHVYKRPGEYFGEIALISDGSATRKATVRATGDYGCSILTVCRKDFDEILGPIKPKLQSNIDKYPSYKEFFK